MWTAVTRGLSLTLFVLFGFQVQIFWSLPTTSSTFKREFGGERMCRHSFPQVSDIPHPVVLEGEGRVKRGAEKYLRIKVFYHDSVDKLDKVKKNIVKKRVVPDAVNYWQKVLKVVGGGGKVKINRKCEGNQYFLSPDDPDQYCKNNCVETKCGEFLVPKDHLEACNTCDERGLHCKTEEKAGKGVSNADFVLYVSALATAQCDEAIGGKADTVAYAAHCQQEARLDRPVAGHTNICPASIINVERSLLSLTSTIKHELLHALGFSSSLFAYYRDKQGRPLTERLDDGKPAINQKLQVRQWSNRTIIQVGRNWRVRKGTLEKTTHLVVTPTVVREVRAHFDCSTLEGAELEDQGGDGTALTHWEKRIFQNEAMTGTVHTAKPSYTRLTFALMEDTGWYVPNYTMAHEINWGKRSGCDFATKSCMELMEKANIEETTTPFCNSLMKNAEKTYCTADGIAMGSCNLILYEKNLPDIYQNFDAIQNVSRRDIKKVGSAVSLADFCPYVQEFTWRGGGLTRRGEARGTRCENEENEPEESMNFGIETYGRNSKCFYQGKAWQQKSCATIKQWSRFGSGCYKHSCTNGLLNIIVRNVTYSCHKQGQTIPIQLLNFSDGEQWLHDSSLICPACTDFCQDCSRENRALKDHFDKRENLGDCIKEALDDNKSEDGQDISGFLNSFGFG